jgi:hypothetical protein
MHKNYDPIIQNETFFYSSDFQAVFQEWLKSIPDYIVCFPSNVLVHMVTPAGTVSQ